MSYLKKSPWVIHYDASSCNGCDIEVLACLTPVYDLERFGIVNTGNPKHADIFLVTGSVNEQNKEVIQNIYHQMPDPKVVVALGICATSGGIFRECYNVSGGIDKILPVDVYVPGCAVRPEAIIDGVIQALKVLEEKHKKFQAISGGKEDLDILPAQIQDSQEILALQKLAYQGEAEIYNDFSLSPLTQTLEELRNDFKDKLFLKSVMHDKIIGSVRAFIDQGTCHIGRLIVHPSYQNYGLGKKLLQKIEETFPQAIRFEVFIGHKSRRNIYFYQKAGYKVFKLKRVSEIRQRVFMEKFANGVNK
jgi:ech hydrogenase subunit C